MISAARRRLRADPLPRASVTWRANLRSCSKVYTTADAESRAAASTSSAGPAHLGDFLADLDFIPAQPPRDFLYRDATNEHLAQSVHLRIRPLSAGIHGQRFVICLGPPRIED